MSTTPTPLARSKSVCLSVEESRSDARHKFLVGWVTDVTPCNSLKDTLNIKTRYSATFI